MTRLSPNRQKWLFSLLLVLVTLAVYWPVRHHDFINYDDDDYVYANDTVKAGLTWNGFVWSFMGAHAVNWHPLTWLSHMLDCQLFGVNPGAHHLVNVSIHCANAVLLLWLLELMTGKFWRSAFVAALFALHPLRVESVAWVAERKDVLCSFFFLLTLLMYARHVYAQNRQAKSTPGIELRLTLLFYVLALLSKPMVVTLPFILLLLDFWPLRRFEGRGLQPATLKLQLHEKWPFFLLSAIFSGITLLAQHSVLPSQPHGPSSVLTDLMLKYLDYVEMILWPHDQSFLYPRPEHISSLSVLLAALIVVGISVWSLMNCRRWPWLTMGWFWFLVMLLPVTAVPLPGLFIADRYTYLPGIGFSVMVIWSIAELLNRLPAQKVAKTFACVFAVAVLVMCTALTCKQIGYWQNTQTLLGHALEIDPNNGVAQINLRVYQFDQQHPGVREKVTVYPNGTTNQPVHP
ncbi:MAG TPA: hypothetical protein VG347_21595 [Verrucomicrobiae bacterium]|nr:hypothetical protein [Verrucomicrobiae bacterium]